MGDVTRGLIITDVRVQDTPFSAKKKLKISTNECRIIKKKVFRLHLGGKTVDTPTSYRNILLEFNLIKININVENILIIIFNKVLTA